MTPEQIAKLDQDKRLERDKRIKEFIKKIETSGFIINDYIKVTELTELVAKGEIGPINQLNNLVNLKTQMDSFDVVKMSSDFKRDLRNEIDRLVNSMSKNTKAPMVSVIDKNITETERFRKLISKIKTKAGIFLAENQDESAFASREETYRKIQDLSDNTSLNAEQKMVEYKRLLYIYNGANLDTIKSAKNITDRGNINITIDYVEDLMQEFNKIYQEVVIMNLDDNTKKAMIDNFSNISAIGTKYKAMLSTFISHQQRSERLLKDLGISFNKEMNFEKEEEMAANEKISEREALPVTLETSTLDNIETQPEIEKGDNVLKIEGEIPERFQKVENNLGEKVTSIKDAKYKGYGTLTRRLIALAGIASKTNNNLVTATLEEIQKEYLVFNKEEEQNKGMVI